METAMNDVPTFKLAKVGKERDRRRGGGAWWSGARGAGSGFGGLGGAGSEGAAGLFAAGGLGLGKTLALLAVCAVLGAGAWEAGKMLRGADSAAAPGHAKLFADRGTGKYANTSDVVRDNNSIPNSIGYVTGSDDGLTPEERARKAAEAEAARKAAAEAAAKKQSEDAAAAAKAAKDTAAADKAPTDATAAAAANGGEGYLKNAFASHFGALSNGLSGGSGLSGGIGQSFGGSGGGFAPPAAKGTNGTLSAMASSARPSTSRSTPRATPRSGGNAFSQLGMAQRAGAAAAGTSGETSATTAGAPFDGGVPGGGTSIDGPGAGYGSNGGAGVNSGANNPGGNPVGGGGSSCSAGQGMDANGSCTNLSTPTSANAAQYQGLIDVAMALMAIVAILAVIAMAFDTTQVGKLIAKYLQTIMEVMGLAIAAIGAMIFAMTGDKMIGGIVTAVGLATAGWAYFADDILKSAATTIQLGDGALIPEAVGLLAASSASANKLGAM